jgi:hypothetical protein
MNEEHFNEIIRGCKSVIDDLKTEGITSVCICGSSRFCDLMAVVKWELEKAGIMATGLHYLPDWYVEYAKWKLSHHGAEQENVARILDELHLRKIDKYDCVLVINYNKYIGDRTKTEINYAFDNKKPVYYFE